MLRRVGQAEVSLKSYPEIRTILPSSLEPLLVEYKRTGDPRDFERIIAKITKLILRMIWQERKKYTELDNIRILELFDASLIALDRAVKGFDVNKSSMYSFPRYLQGHIKEELKKYTRQERKYVSCGLVSVLFEDKKKSYEQAQDQKDWLLTGIDIGMALDDMIKNKKIPGNGKELFKMRYREELTYKEMVEKAGGTEEGMRKVMSRMEGRLINYFKI